MYLRLEIWFILTNLTAYFRIWVLSCCQISKKKFDVLLSIISSVTTVKLWLSSKAELCSSLTWYCHLPLFYYFILSMQFLFTCEKNPYKWKRNIENFSLKFVNKASCKYGKQIFINRLQKTRRKFFLTFGTNSMTLFMKKTLHRVFFNLIKCVVTVMNRIFVDDEFSVGNNM